MTEERTQQDCLQKGDTLRDPSHARHIAEIDWQRWRPRNRATLTFVIRDGQILLIRKLRGLGAGKINAPGGKLEPRESPLQCAIRETEEELCVTPTGLSELGELRFQFTDGYSIRVFVFSARDCVGQVQETEEAIPMWTPIDKIPYSEMWADDELWLPLLLEGKRFAGRFIFAEDEILDYVLDTGE